MAMAFELSPAFQLPKFSLQINHQLHHTSAPNPKIQAFTLTHDQVVGAESVGENGKRKASTWKRMKWSDNMVRILIMIVYFIDDEVIAEGNDKKRGGGGGVGQKKGKWKMVSSAMMDKGFNVSPQQCEDKFNDLNKRYKRAIDILGSGNSCRVVENPDLVDELDHLSPSLREEVKKLITSKHLFFKEMFDYHNSCGTGTGTGGATLLYHEQQLKGSGVHPKDAPDFDEEDASDDDGVDSEEDGNENSNETGEFGSRKMLKSQGVEYSAVVQELEADMMSVLHDGTKNLMEKSEWIKRRLMGLEQRRMNIASQSFELEKERFKWMKFSRKKEREMEVEKLMNERLKLENERMTLTIRRKQLDLLHNHDHLPAPSSTLQHR